MKKKNLIIILAIAVIMILSFGIVRSNVPRHYPSQELDEILYDLFGTLDIDRIEYDNYIFAYDIDESLDRNVAYIIIESGESGYNVYPFMQFGFIEYQHRSIDGDFHFDVYKERGSEKYILVNRMVNASDHIAFYYGDEEWSIVDRGHNNQTHFYVVDNPNQSDDLTYTYNDRIRILLTGKELRGLFN